MLWRLTLSLHCPERIKRTQRIIHLVQIVCQICRLIRETRFCNARLTRWRWRAELECVRVLQLGKWFWDCWCDGIVTWHTGWLGQWIARFCFALCRNLIVYHRCYACVSRHRTVRVWWRTLQWGRARCVVVCRCCSVWSAGGFEAHLCDIWLDDTEAAAGAHDEVFWRCPLVYAFPSRR